MEKKSYNFSADVIRVVAIIGVVVIHTANSVYGRPDFFGGISWWFAIVLNSISRISIPLFIMLSGYFILSKDESVHDSLKRALHRIIIPLLFWFVIYVIWNGGKPSLVNINTSLFSRLFGVSVFDLYFLIILAGLYMAAPLIRSFLKKASYSSQRNFTVITVVLGMLCFAIQYLFYLCSPTWSLTYWIPYTGLFVAGYFLGHNNQKIKNTTILVLTYSMGLLITVVGSYLYYLLHNQGNSLLDARGCLNYYTDSYLSINVVIMAICVFVLLMRFNFGKVHSIIRSLTFSIARASFGIYVLHVFFLDILDSWVHLFDPIAPAWLYIIIKWSVIFGLSYISTVLLMKIPGVKRLFGDTK